MYRIFITSSLGAHAPRVPLLFLNCFNAMSLLYHATGEEYTPRRLRIVNDDRQTSVRRWIE